jgi:hypothetical protein
VQMHLSVVLGDGGEVSLTRLARDSVSNIQFAFRPNRSFWTLTEISA